MIDQHNIASKDFSVDLPSATNKLWVVNDSMLFDINERESPSQEVLEGWRLILRDVIDDLSTINKGLYGS